MPISQAVTIDDISRTLYARHDSLRAIDELRARRSCVSGLECLGRALSEVSITDCKRLHQIEHLADLARVLNKLFGLVFS